MISEKKTKKEFDAVKMMRDIRNKIDQETAGMSFEELKEYFKENKLNNRKMAN